IVTGAMAASGAFAFFTVGATSVEALAARTSSGTSAVETASTTSATDASAGGTTHSLRTPSQAPSPPSVNTVITPVVVAAPAPPPATVDDTPGATVVTDSSSEPTVDPTVTRLLATAEAWLAQNGVEGVQFGISKAGVLY